MKKFTLVKIAAGLMLLLVLAMTGLAQDDEWTPEQQELMDRVIAAAETMNMDVDSFTEDRATVENQNITVNLVSMTQELSQQKSLETSATVTLGDEPNGSGTATLNFVSNDGTETMAYTLVAELLYVDEVLYVNASYEQSTENALPLPEGWVEVSDPLDFPEFAQLDLKGFLDYFVEDTEDDTNPLDNIELMLDYITDISSAEEELDGTPVEVITMTMGWEGLATILAESGEFTEENPIFALFETAFGEEQDLLTFSIALDEDEMPVAVTYAFTLNAEDIDMTSVDPSLPAGATMNMLLDNSAYQLRYDVNEVFEPVEAPE